MKIAILIGFVYYNTPYINLESAIIDLYSTFHYLSELKYEKILVITDLENDVEIYKNKDAILKSIVNADINRFIKHLKLSQQLLIHSNLSNTISILQDFIIDSNFLYLYYSGHANIDKLCFPDNTYPTGQFISDILSRLNNKCQIIFIFDCCHGSNFNLPYYLHQSGNFKLNNNEAKYLDKEIVCLMSSNEYEDSNSYYLGSPFTQAILKGLRGTFKTWLDLQKYAQRELDRLIGEALRLGGVEAEIIQTIKIYSSVNIDSYIWYWVNQATNIRMHWNHTNHSLIFYRREEEEEREREKDNFYGGRNYMNIL